jgi:hypothetical protein
LILRENNSSCLKPQKFEDKFKLLLSLTISLKQILMDNFFIDLHCHPSMKPYGHSFGTQPGFQDPNPNKKNCIWHYNPPSLLAKAIQLITGISKFTQAIAALLHTVAFSWSVLHCTQLKEDFSKISWATEL